MIRAGFKIAALFLLLLTAAAAQVPKGRHVKGRLKGDQAMQFLDRLDRMNPEDRQRALDRFPPARRRLIERNLSEYRRLSPEQKQDRRKRFDDFQAMPEERRDALRKVYRKFTEFPDDRRPFLRREMAALSKLSAEERHTRLASSDFKSRFNAAEIDLLNDLASALDDEP